MDYTWTKLYYGFIFLGDRNKCHVEMKSQCFYVNSSHFSY